MKIEKARAAAALFFLLYKLGMLSEKRYRRLINYLTARSLVEQMKENPHGKPSSEE